MQNVMKAAAKDETMLHSPKNMTGASMTVWLVMEIIKAADEFND